MTESTESGAAPAAEESQTDKHQPREEPQDERTRVLRMVADRRITVDEAVELLKALQPDSAPSSEHAPHEQHNQHWGPWGSGPFFARRGPPGPPWGQRDNVRWEQRFGPFDVRMKRGGRGRGGRHEGDVLFTAPVPPMPPMPPTPHTRPFPPAPPTPGVHPMPPIPPSPPLHGGGLAATRVLVFDVRASEKRYNARLPLGLVGEIDRFLPRQVRQALQEHEIDPVQLIELVNNMDTGHGGQLIDIQDDEEDKRLTVRIEIPGHPERG